MAKTLARDYNNIYDLVKGDDSKRVLIEVAQKSCPTIEDMPMLAGTESSGNKTKLRAGYPKGSWTKLYEGVTPEKSKVSEVVDDCGNLESILTIDSKELDMCDNKAKLIAEEEKGFMIGFGQTVEENVFYGLKNGKSFTGLAARYNTLSKKSDIGNYVVDAGGRTAGKQTSIYLVVWSPLTVFGFHGKNATAGFSKKPKGMILTQAPEGKGTMDAYCEHFNWNIGLAVSDYRSVVRIANIDVNNLENVDLDKYLITAQNRIKNKKFGTGMIYMSEDVKNALDIRRNAKNNVQFTPAIWNGEEIESLRGMGIRVSDAIVGTEEVVE